MLKEEDTTNHLQAEAEAEMEAEAEDDAQEPRPSEKFGIINAQLCCAFSD